MAGTGYESRARVASVSKLSGRILPGGLYFGRVTIFAARRWLAKEVKNKSSKETPINSSKKMSSGMNKQKKIFLIVSVLFVLTVIGFSIHIFSVTTLPGRKGQLRKRIEQRLESDSTRTDTARTAE